jgi:hypothetical protein
MLEEAVEKYIYDSKGVLFSCNFPCTPKSKKEFKSSFFFGRYQVYRTSGFFRVPVA